MASVNELDDADKAYFDSLVSDEDMLLGFITAVLVARPDGKQAWKTHFSCDQPMTTTLGLFEIARLDMIARSGVVAALNTHVDEDDE